MDVTNNNAASLDDMNYKQLYFASQKVVCQLETELHQYAKMFESIEEACTLQICDIHNQVHQYIINDPDICDSHGVNRQLEKELQEKVNLLQQQLMELKERNESHTVSLRQIIQTQEQRIDDLENELFEQCELLSGQRDAIQATELQHKHTKTLFAKLTDENTKLRNCFNKISVKEQEMRNQFEVCAEKLASLQHKLHSSRQHWKEMTMENEYLCIQLLAQCNQELSTLKIKAGCQVPATYQEESANEQEINVQNQSHVPQILSGEKSISIILPDLESEEHHSKIKEKMEVIKNTFKEILRCSSLVEKALKSSLSDLTLENENLKTELSQMEYTHQRLNADLCIYRQDLDHKQQECLQLRLNVEEMGDRFGDLLDQGALIEKQKGDLKRLENQLQSLQFENEALSVQIKEISQKEKVPVDREMEINQLTKKVSKYRLQVADTELKMEDMSKKAASRMQKLEHNWRAADSEVCKLDSLIVAIRAILVNHSLAKDEQLKTVINMIDGK